MLGVDLGLKCWSSTRLNGPAGFPPECVPARETRFGRSEDRFPPTPRFRSSVGWVPEIITPAQLGGAPGQEGFGGSTARMSGVPWVGRCVFGGLGIAAPLSRVLVSHVVDLPEVAVWRLPQGVEAPRVTGLSGFSWLAFSHAITRARSDMSGPLTGSRDTRADGVSITR